MIESILLTSTHIHTFSACTHLTSASGFFFERDGRLFLVTSRHVMRDEGAQHFPDHIEIEVHTDPENIAASTGFRCRFTTTARACGVRDWTPPVRSMSR